MATPTGAASRTAGVDPWPNGDGDGDRVPCGIKRLEGEESSQPLVLQSPGTRRHTRTHTGNSQALLDTQTCTYSDLAFFKDTQRHSGALNGPRQVS